MKNLKKALVLLLCAILLIVGSVMGTLAYLTAQDTVKNTFTVGDVAIELDEAKVNEMGELVYVEDGEGNTVLAPRVEGNTYHLLPGHTYVKDPTVTLRDDNEPAYVRMLVTVNKVNALEAAMPEHVSDGMFKLQNLVDGWNKDLWACVGYTETPNGEDTVAVYEFRYRDVAAPATKGETKTFIEANELTPLFTAIKMPGNGLTNTEIANLQGVEITVAAQAIQADGFANADAAWTAFDQQTATP